jgi:hypothetical protein
MIFGCRLSAIEGDQPPLPQMANPILPPICHRLAADCKPIANQPQMRSRHRQKTVKKLFNFFTDFENGVKNKKTVKKLFIFFTDFYFLHRFYFVHDFFSLFFSVKKAFQKTKQLISRWLFSWRFKSS